MKKMFRFSDWPIAVKLIVSMVGLSLVALVTTMVITSVIARQALQSIVSDNLLRFAEQQGSEIGPQIEAEIVLLETAVGRSDIMAQTVQEANNAYSGSEEEALGQILALDEEWRAGSADGQELIEETLNNVASDNLSGFVEDLLYYQEVFITDKYGAAVAASNIISDYYQADEDWWQIAWNNGQGAVYISDPVFDESVGQIIIEFAMPVVDRHNDEVIGVLKGAYSLDQMIAFVSTTELGESGAIHLISRNGSYIADPDANIGDPVPEGLLLNGSVFTGSGFELDAEDEAGRVVVAWAPVTTEGSMPSVDNLGWVIQVTEARDEAFALVRQTTLTTAVVAVIAALAAGGIALLLSNLLARQVNEIDSVFRQVAVGEFDARAKILGDDELGNVASGINALLSQMSNLLREAEQIADIRLAMLENTDIFAGIGLLEDASAIYVNPAGMKMVGRENEDYTELFIANFHPDDELVRVENEYLPTMVQKGVWSGQSYLEHVDGRRIPVDMTYALINDANGEPYAVGALMRDTTEQRAANDALVAALDDLRRVAAEVQSVAGEVSDTSISMREVTSLMSGQASNSADMAERAASVAQVGDQTVSETIAAMNRIRTNTQETSQRIKRLGEVSQEIGEAARLIEDLSDRTTVLALNASIQAAAAGEAGRGFAVVAEEVQRLAERATGATRQIDQLIINIRAEANEAMVSVEQVTREVVEGSNLAQTAGEHMTSLNQLARELNTLIQHLTETTAEQTNETLTTLTELTEGLTTSVAAFQSTSEGSYRSGNGNREATLS